MGHAASSLAARAAAGGAHLQLLELHRPPGARLGFLEADLDLGLEVAAPPPARAARPERPALVELGTLERAVARAEVAEDRAEELREAAEVARLVDVHAVAARTRPPGWPPNPPGPASA